MAEESERPLTSGAAAHGTGAVAATNGGIAAGRDIYVQTGSRDLGPGEEVLWRAYLGRVIEQTEILPLAVVDREIGDGRDDLRLKLPAVYTALSTRSARFEPGRDRAPKEEARVTLSALEQVDQHRKLVLLGDPGSGKSTFVHFLALCLAGEVLGRPEANLTRLTAPLPGQGNEGAEKKQPWRHGRLLPLRVVLRDFAAKGFPGEPGEPGTARRLWEFLRAELTEAGHGDFFPVLQRELFSGRGLVLLDGLDEVPEADDRRRQMREAVADFATGIGESRVLVTGRPYAYQDPEARLAGFEVAVLAPFERAQIGQFVKLWYEHQVALGRMEGSQAQGRGELLRRAISRSDRLRSLAERPLLLTLMASLHALRGGDLPERREQLYEEAVELLLATWERQRLRRDRSGQPIVTELSLAAWLNVDRGEVRRALEQLAYEAHAAQAERMGTADLPGWRVAERLLEAQGRSAVGKSRDERPLLQYLENRSGLLLARGRGVYAFPHRTFQEYLAACHLTGADTFPDEVARLGREDPDRWREVVLLIGAKMGRGAVWYLAEALCDRDPEEGDLKREDEWGALLAAQAVAESADLTRVGRANEAKLARLRKWLLYLMRAEHFPARERVAAGRVLGKLGDPRFDETRWNLPREPLLGFVEVPEGSFWMGSDKDADLQAYDDEFPKREVRLPRYWMARYPVTVGQYRAFLSASGGVAGDPRGLERSAHQPVAYVSWEEAMAYCRWLGDRLREIAAEMEEDPMWRELAAGRLQAILPSETEWEKAARGTDGRIYPWGATIDPNRLNFKETEIGEPSPVGCFPGGASPCGCEEMCGNVWEWTRSVNRSDRTEDGREDLEASPQIFRILRGGAFSYYARRVRCASRDRDFPVGRFGHIGFRVVLSPFRSDP